MITKNTRISNSNQTRALTKTVMPTATGARTISDVPTSNQWTVATEPNQKQFPDSSSLVSTAKRWATENLFSLFKIMQ